MKWARSWMEDRVFHTESEPDRPTFVIVIPPPNVTGALHMGHALDYTLQDIFVRWNRMKGRLTVWVPGTDHAGIATQTVIERHLAREGLDRFSIGREAFLEKAWQWKEEYAQRIRTQLVRLGASCDWQRERFTLDEGFSKAVRTAFIRLYEDGLIYRGERLINWCPRCLTALSDLEVEHHEIQGRLYWIKYPFKDGSGGITVATTRPETLLGDTAVAVHPDDERYTHVHGKILILPVLHREIPIITDARVQPEFGTGAVKVTPAHDPTDFMIGQDHGLPAISVMDEHAKMNENAGPYKGQDRFEARKRIVEQLREEGLLEKVEPYKHAVGHCYRCDTILEPRLSKQWFVSTKPLAERALEYADRNKPRFIPENWGNVYREWLVNIRDWCISRQIWWGHRIPAGTCNACDHIEVGEHLPQHCPACQNGQIIPETDVLDTWFSSGLWPLGVFGWPDETPDLKVFYPTTLLVTGFDIIFFWVARMVMFGLYFRQDIPFHDVFIHGLVRDERGQKMSKTRGNVVDPMDIARDLGVDSLRLTLARLAAPGMDVPFSEQTVKGYRTFMNKMWNATRFVLMHCDDQEQLEPIRPEDELDHIDKWILTRLYETSQFVHESLKNYIVNESSRSLYNFFWNDFCDWYIELSKPYLQSDDRHIVQQKKRVLVYVLDQTFRLFHPFIPFITEELWHELPITKRAHGYLALESIPDPENIPSFQNEAKTWKKVQDIVAKIRQIRTELGVSPHTRIPVRISPDTELHNLFITYEKAILPLAGLSEIVWDKPKREKGWVYDTLHSVHFEIFIGSAIDLKKELERLQRELQKLGGQLQRLEQRLKNPQFRERAPEHVVKETQMKHNELKNRYEKVFQYVEHLKNAT